MNVVEYDWQAFVGDTLRAPYNAQRVGDSLADQVLRSPARLRYVHVIGVSVGAFVADRLATRLATAAPESTIRLTLLDPFCARGLPGLINPSSAYGVTTFGRSAAIAECVLNTDDPVRSDRLKTRPHGAPVGIGPGRTPYGRRSIAPGGVH